MKATSLLVSSLVLTSLASYASPTLTVGTPANSLLASPAPASPSLGGLAINFDNYTPGTTYGPGSPLQFSYGGVPQATISSPDQTMILPYSTQSAPNFLFDNSGDGTADLTIQLMYGVQNIAVGIADSDPVSITLQALNSSGMVLGGPFSVTIDNSTGNLNPGNGYFELSDTTADIWGLRIRQTSASADYSGLAIDDVQFAPEPASVAMFACGALLVAGLKLRKRA